MRTMSYLLVPFLLVIVILLTNVRAHTLSHHKPENDTTGDILQAIANHIPSHNTEIREWDVARHRFWETYRKSAISERPKIVKDLNKALTHMEYVNSRIEMMGLLLFGPEKARSTLRSVRAPERIVDDLKCFKSTLKSFEKHCCLLPELGLRHIRAFANICNYVAEKEAIKEALIVSCAMTKTKEYGIDVRNPSVEATPAPVPELPDNYCARIFVNGTSRKKLESYARPYRVLLALSPEVHQRFIYAAEKVQICFHKDASRGLCKCGKDEWRSLRNGTWSSLMSPYEQRYVDVKYTSAVYGSVTATLLEVSQGWRYVLLVVGISLLLLARVVCKWVLVYLLSRDVDDVVFHSIKWVIRVIALTCIFESSIDTPLAKVAIVTWLGLHIVMSSIKMATRINLDRRGIELNSVRCPICDDDVETEDHVFLHCKIARDTWKDVLKWWHIPNMSLQNLQDVVYLADNSPLPSKPSRFFDVVVQTTIWSLWRFRNNTIFSPKRPSTLLLFNDIKTSSYHWIASRCRNSHFSWIDWFNNPCKAVSHPWVYYPTNVDVVVLKTIVRRVKKITSVTERT